MTPPDTYSSLGKVLDKVDVAVGVLPAVVPNVSAVVVAVVEQLEGGCIRYTDIAVEAAIEKAVLVRALTHSFVHLDAVAAAAVDNYPEAIPAVDNCCNRALYGPDGYCVHEEFELTLWDLADDETVATAYMAPLEPAQVIADIVESLMFVGVIVSYALFRNLTKYLTEPSRAANMSEQGHTLDIDFVEQGSYLMGLHSYCSSFRLHRDC